MNANFRFLVRSNGNYALQLTNPDDYVDWVDVQQVVLNSTDELSCPICLCAPIAPRMTACGHIFCFPCVLRYLGQAPETQKRTWRKCPICYDPVYSKALKPVLVYHAPPPPQPPCSLNFRLLYRYQDSTVTLPVSDDISTGELPWDDVFGALIFTKLALSTARHLANHLKADRLALAEALLKSREENEVEEAKFISAAHAEVSLSLTLIPHNQPQIPSSKSPTEVPRELHRFYQSEDGQHIYIHPLHSRILFDHYRAEGSVPESTTLPIIHYEETTINEEMRRRFKYFSFLPLGCDVAFVDLDLKSLVRPEILKNYQAPLEARARHLEAKLRAEQLAEVRANPKFHDTPEPKVEPVVLVGSDDFPEMPTSSTQSASTENESSNWAAMAIRSRASHSEWMALHSEQRYLAPRTNRTLADDIELALSESMSALDTNASKSTKKGKKKLISFSSNTQRRR